MSAKAAFIELLSIQNTRLSKQSMIVNLRKGCVVIFFHPFNFSVLHDHGRFTPRNNGLCCEEEAFNLQLFRAARLHSVSLLPRPAWAIRSKNSACVEQSKCASSEMRSPPTDDTLSIIPRSEANSQEISLPPEKHSEFRRCVRS